MHTGALAQVAKSLSGTSRLTDYTCQSRVKARVPGPAPSRSQREPEGEWGSCTSPLLQVLRQLHARLEGQPLRRVGGEGAHQGGAEPGVEGAQAACGRRQAGNKKAG